MNSLKTIPSKKLVYYLLIFLAIFSAIFLLGTRISKETIINAVQKTGMWAPLIFILINTATLVIAPLSGTPVIFAGYALFGKLVAPYIYLADILSAVINFWISRLWGRKLVSKLVGKKGLAKIDEFTKNYGVSSLIFLRVLQSNVTDFVSYAYGLTNMKFSTYIIISVLGQLPNFLLWQFLFQKIRNMKEFIFWWVVTLIPLGLISIFFAIKYKAKQDNREENKTHRETHGEIKAQS